MLAVLHDGTNGLIVYLKGWRWDMQIPCQMRIISWGRVSLLVDFPESWQSETRSLAAGSEPGRDILEATRAWLCGATACETRSVGSF